MQWAAIRALTSLKKETLIILVVLVSLMGLPVFAVVSSTDLTELLKPGYTLYNGPASTTNTYDFGYCTFWAAKRRAEVGLPIPNTWGDAHTWDDRAATMGYTVDHTPAQYAILETDRGALGHVAFVEEVYPDGSFEISEMNAKGWDILDNRKIAASEAKNYNFIH